MIRIRYFLILVVSLILTDCGGDRGRIGGSGLLEADEAIISAETAGRVISVLFSEGAQLAAGDTLAVIDPSRLELELASVRAGEKVARVQLEVARVQLARAGEAEKFASSERDRVARLLSSGTATQKQLDQLEFELTQARLSRKSAQAGIATVEAELKKIAADLSLIRRRLTDCYPVVPIDGLVTEKYVEVGELLNPGQAIGKVSQLSSLWVKVYLPAGDFAGVKIGDKATIDTETGENELPGEVIWTSEEAEFTPKNVQTQKARANLMFAVKVKVENIDGNLKIGMPVYVTIGE
jgi:HlyD family secretion protein